MASSAAELSLVPVAGWRTDSRLAASILGVAIVATSAGMAAAALRGDGTAINAYLFLALEMSNADAARIERIAIGAVFLLSVVALCRPGWPVLLPVAAYILAEALARWDQQGLPYSEWSVPAHAARYLTPLAAILLAGKALADDDAGRGWRMAAEWCLRIGLSVVFIVHGLEALNLHPGFVDLIIGSGYNLGGLRISESAASLQLQVIGIVDLGVAAAILLRVPRALLWWAAIWGAVTAFSRMTAFGWGAYPEVLVRASHILGPVAVWLLARRRAADERGVG
jgi:hypothetical protein